MYKKKSMKHIYQTKIEFGRSGNQRVVESASEEDGISKG